MSGLQLKLATVILIVVSYSCQISLVCADSEIEDDKTNGVTYSYGEMTLFANKTSYSILEKICVVYESDYPLQGNLTRYKLKNDTHINPCDLVPPSATLVQKEKTLLLMKVYQNCSLNDYLDYAEKNNASGLLLIIKKAYQLTGNHSHPENLEVLAYTYPESASRINDYIEKEPYVELQELEPDLAFEWSTIVLGALACFCVAVGALTGPYYEPHRSNVTHQQILDGDSNEAIVQREPSALQVYFNVKVVLMMVVFISTTLMLLYFFFEYLVYFFMVVFCIASGRALFEILIQLLNLCHMDERMPLIKGHGIHRWILACLCIAIPVTWFILRHNAYIWILEDILGVCFCIHLIQTMKIPNLKICTVLLSLLFIYDIFFVFITPYMTTNGKSIMVEVATGAGSGERLPLLLQIPRLRPGSACFEKGYSLLGFGDIILPGFLVGFANAYDIARRDKYRPYFITAMLGYTIGLSFAFIALYLTRAGQPALLYIVPATLIPLFIVSLARKQARDIWLGVVRT